MCLYFRGLLPKILGRLNKFYEIKMRGWPRELLIVVKRKTVRKWELTTCRKFVNLRTEDFFVDQSCRMWRCYQNICNRMWTMNMYLYAGLQKVMRIVIPLGFCEMMPSCSGIVLGNMMGTVNECICVFWNGCWGAGRLSDGDMRGVEDNFLDRLGFFWFGGDLYASVWQ